MPANQTMSMVLPSYVACLEGTLGQELLQLLGTDLTKLFWKYLHFWKHGVDSVTFSV